jgi:hypothetical protein
MPNQLVSDNGVVLYHNPFTTTLAETLADFRIHIEHAAGVSSRVPVHRVLVREISEVLTDPRIVKSEQFALLGQQADALRAGSNRPGRIAFLHPSQRERQHEINVRRNKQLTLLTELGIQEDPVSIARLAGELSEVKDRLAFRGMQLRTAQVLSEVNSQPQYLTEVLGPRPAHGNLRVINAWQVAAEKIVGRRIDLGMTGDADLGLNLERDYALTRTISSARQALGLGTHERGVHAGIGF